MLNAENNNLDVCYSCNCFIGVKTVSAQYFCFCYLNQLKHGRVAC